MTTRAATLKVWAAALLAAMAAAMVAALAVGMEPAKAAEDSIHEHSERELR